MVFCIALQINNWNEAIKDKKIENQYVFNLLTDLEGQIELCNKIIESESQKENWANNALALIHSNDLDNQVCNLDSLLRKLIPRRTFTEYNSTFEDLKSSGNINRIKDQDLRKAITDYYHNVKNVSSILALNSADLDATYKTSMNLNKFGFFRDSKGALKNDQLKKPIGRESLIRLVNQKKYISRNHKRRLQNLNKLTYDLQERLRGFQIGKIDYNK